jgi:hypothetical protein
VSVRRLVEVIRGDLNCIYQVILRSHPTPWLFSEINS